MLSYHFAFLVIAVSVFGLGIGELLYAKYRENFDREKYRFFVFVSFLILIALSSMLLLPIFESSVGQQVLLLLYIIFAAVPFLLIGILFSSVFQQNSDRSYLLYTFDLIGASTGALISAYLFDSTGILLIFASLTAFLFVLTVIILSIEKKGKLKPILIAAIITPAFALMFINLKIPIAMDEKKDLLRLMSSPATETKIIESRWSLFGKTDLVEFSYPDGSKSSSIFIDGAAGSAVISLNELEKSPEKINQTLKHFPGFFPFRFLEEHERDTSLIIGPGGGIDIAANYFGKANFIEAVEVNPSFIDLMKKYNSSTFDSKPNIKIIRNEGRNYVRKFKEKYDLIFLTIPITKSSRSIDFYMLTENYLFTVEAIKDYLNALTQDGRLIFTMHGYEEIYRFLFTYLEAMKEAGIDNREAFQHLYIISNGMKPVIVIKKSKFTKEEIEPRHFIAHQTGMNKGVFYFPFVEQIKIDTALFREQSFQWQMFDQILYDAADNRYSVSEVSKSTGFNLSPTFDDSPFFYNFNIGLPDNMAVLLLVLIVVLVWLIVKFRKSYGLSSSDELTDTQRGLFKKYSLISILLGASYFLMQAYSFQILNLNLDSPTKSISLLLFLFLLGNGFGSLLASIIKKDYLLFISIAVFAVIIASLIEYFLLLPALRENSKLFWLIASIGIPAFLLGIPFPLLLKLTVKINSSNGIALLLGLSSIGGAAASSLAIIMALIYGFKSVIILALLIYAIILYIIQTTKKQYFLQEV